MTRLRRTFACRSVLPFRSASTVASSRRVRILVDSTFQSGEQCMAASEVQGSPAQAVRTGSTELPRGWRQGKRVSDTKREVGPRSFRSDLMSVQNLVSCDGDFEVVILHEAQEALSTLIGPTL